MSLFTRHKIVFWPKKNSVEIYFDRKDNNHFSFDIDLWKVQTDATLQPLLIFFQQNKINSFDVLLSDDIIHTKSFLYDTQISSIETKEVVTLAESFVNFKINPELIEYKLVPHQDKTLIHATIYEPDKFSALKENLSKIGLSVSTYHSVASSITSIISRFYKQPYFLIYHVEGQEYTLSLSEGELLYLSANLKGSSLDIQKIINYSNLYFTSPVNKIFLPADLSAEINTTKELDKTVYDAPQIASQLNKAANLPLPVLGVVSSSDSNSAAIIDYNNLKTTSPNMENKRNILPFVAVFIFTAAIASVAIWYFLNRNNDVAEVPTAEPTLTETQSIPTQEPTPTVAQVAIEKDIKIQVLNATDINGQAATLKSELTKLGFTSVAVGNSSQKSTSNKIQLKSTLEGYESYFESELDSFPATVTTDLPASSSYDAVFTIGTDLSKTSSAAVTPSKTATASPTKKTTPTPTETE